MPELGLHLRFQTGRALMASCLLALVMAGCTAQEPVLSEPVAAAPPVVAQAAVDRAVATTGDLITYTIRVDYDPAYTVEIPEAGAGIAGFRIVEIGSEEPLEEDGRVVEERWYQLRADLVGSYVLPPVIVTYQLRDELVEIEIEEPVAPVTGEGEDDGVDDEDVDAADAAEPGLAETQSVETSAIFVEVESVLPETGEATDIRGIKPLQPKTSRIPWLPIGIGVVSVLVLGLIARLLWRRHHRPIPPPPAHELAFAALDALRGTDFDDPEAVRRFYFAVSEVVRSYVEGRFGLNATDLTSDEILERLGEISGLAPAPKQELRRFLIDTDQVKFAARQPQPDEIEQTYERALSFVEATRPVEGEADDTEAEGGGASGDDADTKSPEAQEAAC